MKTTKIIILAAAMLFAAATFVGCSSKEPTETEITSTAIETEATETTETTESVDITIFPEVETSSENLQLYREEVASRLENENFITDEEWNVITENWDTSEVVSRSQYSLCTFDKVYKETFKYYYPVVFREGNALILWYTTESGSVFLEKVYGIWRSNSDYVGKLHSDSEEEVMKFSYSNVLTYDKETGKVTKWELGNAVETYQLPETSIYCGLSSFEGYIFRNGSDVYALRTGIQNASSSVDCIAHNVKYVISASYRYGSDPWSQPLFLMEDGSVKAYISWMGDKEAATDDSSHLCELRYEGGYRY